MRSLREGRRASCQRVPQATMRIIPTKRDRDVLACRGGDLTAEAGRREADRREQAGEKAERRVIKKGAEFMADFTKWQRKVFGDPYGVPPNRGAAESENNRDLQKDIQQLVCDVHEQAGMAGITQ